MLVATNPAQNPDEGSLPIERKAARALSYFARVKENPTRYRDRTSRDKLAMILSPEFDLLKQCFQDSRIGMPLEFSRQYARSDYQQVRDVNDRLSLLSFPTARAVASKVRNHDPRTAWSTQKLPFSRQFTHHWLHELAGATQFTPRELRTLSAKDLIHGIDRVPCSKTGKSKHLISAQRLSEIQAECDQSSTFVKAANRLSVSTATVIQTEGLRRDHSRRFGANPRMQTVRTLRGRGSVVCLKPAHCAHQGRFSPAAAMPL